ncbi:MAG: hypothetical protein AAFV26_06420, partial [Pseudomonadota bacterium]
ARGVIRSVGLAQLFGSVFQTWLEDDDPGLAKTMAMLDRRLRRAESTMSTIDQAIGGAERLKKTVFGGLRQTASRVRDRAANRGGPATDPDPIDPVPAGDI